MALEIERRFLIKENYNMDLVLENAKVHHIIQGYLLNTEEKVVRIRIKDDNAFLCCKKSISATKRIEFEYPIPHSDALFILETMCDGFSIEKKRYYIYHHSLLWEIDYFLQDNSGLILAEVELDSPSQHISLPVWIGKEITENPSFTNAALSKKPFSTWSTSL
ncbi:MAG: CYTH domain-containing protein [Desulfovibrionaceae bacterium]